MLEFTTVSASSYDPSALAAKLTEKSAEVVSHNNGLLLITRTW